MTSRGWISVLLFVLAVVACGETIYVLPKTTIEDPSGTDSGTGSETGDHHETGETGDTGSEPDMGGTETGGTETGSNDSK